MPDETPRLALYDDPLATRRELFEETQNLLTEAGVVMVSQAAFGSAVLTFDEPLWQARS